MNTKPTATECKQFSMNKRDNAGEMFKKATTNRAIRDAMSEYEFWSDKASFYETCEQTGCEFTPPADMPIPAAYPNGRWA